MGAPVIDVSSTQLSFPPVTLGDTTVVKFQIANRGDAPLTITSVDFPPGMEMQPGAPVDIAASDSAQFKVFFAPPDGNSRLLTMTIHSNDPVTPSIDVMAQPDVRLVEVHAKAFTTGGPYPLGEALVIQAVSPDGVSLDEATLFYRSGLFHAFVPQRMTFDGSSFVAIIGGDFVQEGGVEFYVVAENSGYQAFDPPDSSDRPYKVVVESPRTYRLDPVARNPGFTPWRAGENIDFLLQLQRGTVYRQGTLYFRRGGDTLFQQTPIVEASITGIAASIGKQWVGPRGIEYYSVIETSTARLAQPSGEEKNPIPLRTTVESLTEPMTHSGSRYRMLSVPLEMPSGTGLATLLSDEGAFGGYDPTRWRAFRYLPERGANLELSEDASLFTVEPGRAFWLISRDAHRVNTAPVPGGSTPTAHVVTMLVPPGWNQFGNPFAFPVSWATVRRSANLGDPVAFDSDHGDYADEPPSALEPFAGYFIENPTAQPETLRIAPIAVDTAQALPPPLRASRAADEPSLRLEARTARGADLSNHITIASGSSDERDARDQAKPPPPPGSAVRLAIANREWLTMPGLYRRDVRPPADGHTWNLEVTSAERGEPIDVTVRPEATLLAGTTLRLVDAELGSVIDLDAAAPESRYTVLSRGPSTPYRLSLVMGTPSYTTERAEPRAPDRLMLDAVSPNPSADAQRIRFGLPRASTVRLEVFDASGRRVATLLDGAALPAGFHSEIWRPDASGGRPRSGIYFHRLTAGGETRTVRSVVVE